MNDLSAETFLLALRRFIARSSCPTTIISDNATNFRAGAEFLLTIASGPSVVDMTDSKGIIWKFSTPRSPCQGGFYDRLIGIVKSCMKKV